MPKIQEAEGESGVVVFRLVLWINFADFVCFSFLFYGYNYSIFYKLALLASVTMKKK